MKKNPINDEVDIIQVFITIWQYKLQVILITLTTILSVGLYSFFTKQSYEVTTQIKPISIFEENFYLPYNLLIKNLMLEADLELEDIIQMKQYLKSNQNSKTIDDDEKKLAKLLSKFNIIDREYFIINREYLYNYFLEKITDIQLIMDSINKFELIDKKNFKNDQLYLKKIEQLALTLKLIPPTSTTKYKKYSPKEIRNNWSITFKTYNPQKYEEVLSHLSSEINKKIKIELIESFNIQNKTKKILKDYKLEDINNLLTVSKIDYQKKIDQRLRFLNEQAAIARQIDIPNNTLDNQNYYTESKTIADIQTEKSYYMRGYKMIEKEIELIKSRSIENGFKNDLIFTLENEKSILLENKELKRIEKLFSDTPIIKSDNFKAANIEVKKSIIRASNNLTLTLLISTIVGLILGSSSVLIYSAIQKRK